jgi:hypothetical protein
MFESNLALQSLPFAYKDNHIVVNPREEVSFF